MFQTIEYEIIIILLTIASSIILSRINRNRVPKICKLAVISSVTALFNPTIIDVFLHINEDPHRIHSILAGTFAFIAGLIGQNQIKHSQGLKAGVRFCEVGIFIGVFWAIWWLIKIVKPLVVSNFLNLPHSSYGP